MSNPVVEFVVGEQLEIEQFSIFAEQTNLIALKCLRVPAESTPRTMKSQNNHPEFQMNLSPGIVFLKKKRVRHNTVSKLALLLCTLGTLLSGCSVVGPEAIRSGRLAYNEAITETNNQQMLMEFVHNRYQETNQLLTVASVTANVRISSNAQIEAGFGDSDDYYGNLVPFSGGFIYEENPTISYSPVAGDAYLNRLMSPVPLPLVAQITWSMEQPELAYRMLVASINGIRNPAFLYDNLQPDPRFEQFIMLVTDLTNRHCLHWTVGQREAASIELTVESSTYCIDSANELLELLQLPKLRKEQARMRIPVKFSFDESTSGGVGIITHSVWKLVEVMSAAVEVPAEDESSGVVLPAGRIGIEPDLRIRFAKERPDNAYVAVEYRDGWFYIDNRNVITKSYFKLLGDLWTAAMEKSLGTGANSPVLTVPVSR